MIERTILSIILILTFISSAISIKTDPKTCETGYYYDNELYDCYLCPINMTVTSTGTSCECKSGYYISKPTSGEIAAQPLIVVDRPGACSICSGCPECTGWVSADGYSCHTEYNNKTVQHVEGKHECKKLETDKYYYFGSKDPLIITVAAETETEATTETEEETTEDETETEQTDTETEDLTELGCYECPSNTFSKSGAFDCISCPAFMTLTVGDNETYSCSCITGYQLADDICISSTDAQTVNLYGNANPVNLNQVETDDRTTQVTFQSELVDQYYLKAAVGCNVYKSPKQCQILSNLCVLNLYDEKYAACKLYKTLAAERLNGSVESRRGLVEKLGYAIPWLYYQSSSDDVIKKQELGQTVSFDKKKGLLEFQVARFGFNGTFLGFQKLTHQLFICPAKDANYGEDFREFGTNFELSCSFDLSQLFTAQDSIFYEIFILDQNEYIPIPILIRNFESLETTAGQNGPNWDSDTSNYIFVRRFFVYDNILGKGKGTSTFQRGSYIRYAKTIQLKVELNNDENEKIYTPHIVVEYKERSYESISENENADVQFKSVYFMETSNFNQVALIMAVLCGLATIAISILRGWICLKTNPKHVYKPNGNYWVYIIPKIFILFLDTVSTIFFWLLFSIVAYWYIFIKLQTRVEVLLPENTSSDYQSLDILFGFVGISKFLLIVLRIIEQCNYDFFMIDWEKGRLNYDQIRNIRPSTATTGERGLGRHGNLPPLPNAPGAPAPNREIDTKQNLDQYSKVNTWRSILIANELDEMQLYRLISSNLTLFFFLFFYCGLGWEYFSAEEPGVNTWESKSLQNTYLKFFLISVLILSIGAVQYLIKKGVSNWLPMEYQDFTDLCSVCNISIFIFTDLIHGYYLHGLAPSGVTDVNAEMLKHMLDSEQKGDSRGRGLNAGDPQGLQTFEIYIPAELRLDYDKSYMVSGPHGGTGIISDQEDLPHEDNLEKQKRQLNKILQEYVLKIAAGASNYIRERTYCERFLKFPPQIVGNSIFLADPSNSFTNTFLKGLDFDLIMMMALIFFFFTWVLDDPYIATFCTYLLDKLFSELRGFLGQKNMSKKVLIDDRFLG